MFTFRKKPKTVYEKVVKDIPLDSAEDGSYELAVLKGEETVQSVSTDALDVGIMEYFAREPFSIPHIENYFRKHRAMEAKSHFENWLYAFDQMDRPFLGLSILLMRDSEVTEAVKFGIYLTQFTDLSHKTQARKIVEELGRHDAFSYYALDALLKSADSTHAFYELGSTLTGRGKEIYETMAKALLEKGRK
ncbi:Uncharacterised protein [Aedoeadaptatus ivorii]|uniref:Uncharacterized protein n=1 Tax=Aedoeadaptatus ivorii TaxID=54006 RepID=A0A3S5C2P7_9FIRM|nr:hypothetical protein [Peptoniphilus ivorii]MDQ0508895.1 hypothetical protein [Peptoniphilus ivorii]VEJ35986.1 Uncharacterised protein [Peptoniphilus ivorii]